MLSQDHHTHPYRLQFTYHALPDKGCELTLSIKCAAPVKITVQDMRNALVIDSTESGGTMRDDLANQ